MTAVETAEGSVSVPSRRGLLAAGAAAAGITVVGGTGVVEPAVAAGSAPRRSHYAGSVGKVFRLVQGRRTWRVRLVAIRDHRSATARQRPHNFTLVLVPLGARRPPDGIYALARRRVPTHRLLVSELGDGRSMQVVVRRQR